METALLNQYIKLSFPNFRKPFNFLLLVLFLINVLPLLAPFLMYWGIESLAKPIYFLYSFTCHQFAHRSLHIHDHQCAWCSRDMAIWGALLAVALLVKFRKVTNGLPWYWLIPFTIPIALDGGIQTIATVLGVSPDVAYPLYISNNFMRVITGSFFGLGLGLFMFPPLANTDEAPAQKTVAEPKRLNRWRLARYVLFIGAIIFSSYISATLFWSLSSQYVKPANIVDLQVKTPDAQEFFLRRETGACPANVLGEDPLALKCFWGI